MKFSRAKYYLTKHFLNKGQVRSLWLKELNPFCSVPREQSELGSMLFLSKTVEKVSCNIKIENVMSKKNGT